MRGDKKDSSKSIDKKINELETTTQTSLLILEALEEVSQVVRKSSTREDIEHVVSQIQSVVHKQQDYQNELNALRENIRTEFQKMIDGLRSEGKNLHGNIIKLEGVMGGLQNQMGVLHNKHSEIQGSIATQGARITDSIKQKTNYTPWVIFLLVQIAFAGVYIYYQKFKEVKRTHMY